MGVVGRETQSTVHLETVEILEWKEVYWEEGLVSEPSQTGYLCVSVYVRA